MRDDFREAETLQSETTGEKGVLRIFQSEPTAKQRMRLIELSGVLDFWDNPSEDVYSVEDGDPI